MATKSKAYLPQPSKIYEMLRRRGGWNEMCDSVLRLTGSPGFVRDKVPLGNPSEPVGATSPAKQAIMSPTMELKVSPISSDKFYANMRSPERSPPSSLKRKREGWLRERQEDRELQIDYLRKTGRYLLKEVWKIFPKQQLAFEFEESLPELPLHTFAFEDEGCSEGSRKYLVTTYAEFWRRY